MSEKKDIGRVLPAKPDPRVSTSTIPEPKIDQVAIPAYIRPAVPALNDNDPYYRMGALIAETNQMRAEFREQVQNLREQVQSLKNEDAEIYDLVMGLQRDSTATKTTMKLVAGLIGLVFASIVSLGTWMVHTTIVSEQNIRVLQQAQDVQNAKLAPLEDIKYDVKQMRTEAVQSERLRAEHEEALARRLDRLDKHRR